MNWAKDMGKVSLPKLTLMAISQIEAMLTKTVTEWSSIIMRDLSGN